MLERDLRWPWMTFKLFGHTKLIIAVILILNLQGFADLHTNPILYIIYSISLNDVQVYLCTTWWYTCSLKLLAVHWKLIQRYLRLYLDPIFYAVWRIHLFIVVTIELIISYCLWCAWENVNGRDRHNHFDVNIQRVITIPNSSGAKVKQWEPASYSILPPVSSINVHSHLSSPWSYINFVRAFLIRYNYYNVSKSFWWKKSALPLRVIYTLP